MNILRVRRLTFFVIRNTTKESDLIYGFIATLTNYVYAAAALLPLQVIPLPFIVSIII